MKKISLIAALAVFGVGIVVHAATVTNKTGQVITTTTTSAGVTITITDPNSAASETNRLVEAVGSQLDMAANTTATLFTPRNYGDMLIGKEGSTGKVWIATGLTTNDWKAIYDP